MVLRNIKTGVQFECSAFEYQRDIVAIGNAYKFEIVQDDTPLEIHVIRKKKQEESKPKQKK